MSEAGIAHIHQLNAVAISQPPWSDELFIVRTQAAMYAKTIVKTIARETPTRVRPIRLQQAPSAIESAQMVRSSVLNDIAILKDD
jgi:hypothetical protein